MMPARVDFLMDRANQISVSNPVIATAVYIKPDRMVPMINKNNGKTWIGLGISKNQQK